MQTCFVFYSWQSDLPNATNRGFIQKALEIAAKAIRNDDSVQVEPVIDRDTIGVPGAPDIASTIFAKIEQAQVFVCDVSILDATARRPTPNPNVLIELGYARKVLGHDKVIMVMNTVFGGPELLPFDLRPRRVLTYDMAEEIADRATERRKLEVILEEGLRTILKSGQTTPASARPVLADLGHQARSAIEASLPNQKPLVNRFLDSLWKELTEAAPPFPGTEESSTDDALVEAISKTSTAATEFGRLVRTIAETNSQELASVVFNTFGNALSHQHSPVGFSGTVYVAHADFFKFIGHELFVEFTAALMRENRWELIANLLEETLYIENSPTGRSGLVAIGGLSSRADLLAIRKQRLSLARVSVQADILNQRHTAGELSGVAPFSEFVGADFLLYLRQGFEWRPWSTIYLNSQTPRFLVEAGRIKFAQELLRPLRVEDIESLRKLLIERTRSLGKLFPDSSGFFPLEDFNVSHIGSI